MIWEKLTFWNDITATQQEEIKAMADYIAEDVMTRHCIPGVMTGGFNE